MVKKILFATGNEGKFKEVKEILEEHNDNIENKDNIIQLEQVKIDLPELQGSPEEVAREKVRLAYEEVKEPIFVDDTGLEFNALNGMPGIYVKHFLDAVKPEGMFKMLSGFEDKSAKAFVSIGYHDGKDIHFFLGECNGKIVEPKSTGQGFGWDPIFSPNAYPEDTYATLPAEKKNAISHRRNAFDKFKEYLIK